MCGSMKLGSWKEEPSTLGVQREPCFQQGWSENAFPTEQEAAGLGIKPLHQVSEGTDGGTSHGKQKERYEQGQKLKSTENKQWSNLAGPWCTVGVVLKR